MKLQALNCPACGAPIEGIVNPNQPFVCKACNSTIVSTDWTTSGEIICMECGKVNSGKNRYCDSCQAQLQAGCPFCYTQNVLNAKYCKQCGVDLQKAWKKQHTWLSQHESNKQERTQKWKKERLVSEQETNKTLQRLLLQLDEPEKHPMAIPGIVQFGLQAVPELIRLLESEDPDARYGAAHALGNIRDSSAVPALIKALRDEHPAVRFFALDALGKLKALETAQPIGELLSDENPNVREHANSVLIQFGTPEAIQILKDKSRPKWWSAGG
jgi:hypothetical protein